VLVNNAGMAIFGPLAQSTTQDWRKVMGADLDSVYFASREALPHLLKTKGSIINLSSASGLGGDWGMSAYNAAPEEIAGVIAFLASEDAVFVNGVILPVDGGLQASNGQPNFLGLLG
jgi:meso-butanediol dehydrogenase / (S,S)-butanediol dehydrogenase / diacetyl reductase